MTDTTQPQTNEADDATAAAAAHADPSLTAEQAADVPDEAPVGRGFVVPASESDGDPVAALLPRDWPRQVEKLLDLLYAPPVARDWAFALVDSWVQEATDADAREDDRDRSDS